MKDIFVVIPTLNPGVEELEEFLNKLLKKFDNILLFDDGCREEYIPFFKKCEKKGILVLHHNKNLGKGRSLKDAFNHILVNYPNIEGVVTADSDGQHSVKDIIKCAELVKENKGKLILGCRDFNSPNVPPRNKFGNKTTKLVFKLFVGLSISDTQTGLRGLDRETMNKYLDTPGERFEYENNQLIESIEKKIPIKEFGIDTIYESKENYETHFNPIKDSIAIYKTFAKYIIASIGSFLVDIVLFGILNKFIETIMICTVIARVFSSIFNYFANAKAVFKNSNKTSIIKYFILVIVQMFMSGLLTTIFTGLLSIPSVPVKIVVDSCIFIVNFFIQREFIFKGEK